MLRQRWPKCMGLKIGANAQRRTSLGEPRPAATTSYETNIDEEADREECVSYGDGDGGSCEAPTELLTMRC